MKQDYNKAKENYELLAKQNNSDALYKLGLLYEKGQGVEQDYNKALYNLGNLYELSAQQNNSNALYSLVNLYAHGHGVKQDNNKAKKYYELSSKKDNSYIK